MRGTTGESPAASHKGITIYQKQSSLSKKLKNIKENYGVTLKFRSFFVILTSVFFIDEGVL